MKFAHRLFSLPLLLGIAVANVGLMFPCLGGIIVDGNPGGSDLTIPDNSPAGVTYTIGNAPAIYAVNSITVSLRHSFVGDLIVKVLPPFGPEFVLFDRPGYPSIPETDGYGSNLGLDNSPSDAPTSPASYTFTKIGFNFDVFADPAHAGVTEEISTTPSGFPSYFAEVWVDGSFEAGTWRVFLSDNATGDTGIIAGASLNFQPVPEPVTQTMVVATVLAGLAGLRWRWWRE